MPEHVSRPTDQELSESFTLLPEAGQADPIGVLVLHGLTGNPHEAHYIAQYLHSKGFLVHVPCLSGHAGGIENLRRTSLSEWLHDAEMGLTTVQREGVQKCFIIGMSFGGLLALYLATRYREGLAGVCVSATPLRLRSAFERLALTCLSHSPDELLNLLGTVSKSKHEQPLALPRYALPVHSIAAGARLVGIQRMVMQELYKVTTPLLVFNDPFDPRVAAESPFLVDDGVSSADVTVRLEPGATHHLLHGPRHESVFAAIGDFVSANS